nr:hypothetical protein [Tanacetum cinerariifolium]
MLYGKNGGVTTAMAKTINGEAQIHAIVDGKKIIITEASIRRDLQLVDEEGVDYLPNSIIFVQCTLIGIRKGFSGRITPLFLTMVIQSEMGKGSAMPTDPHYTLTILQTSSSRPQKTNKPRKPLRKVTQLPQPSEPMEHVADEAVHKELGDSLVRAATTASSLEAKQDSGGGPRCQEAMGDTTAQTRVLDLEKTKTSQSNEIPSLKRRVKKLEKKNRSRTYNLKRLYKGRIEAIDVDEDITLVNDQDDADMFDVNDLGGEEVFVAEQEVVSTATTAVTTEELTLSQALKALKTSKPKVKGIVIQEQKEPSKSTSIIATISKQQSQDKGKGIMVEAHVKHKKKDQIRLDEETALRLQTQEQEELTDAEKATLFVQLLEKRRKHFAAKRAEEKRNKPPTQAQKRKIIVGRKERKKSRRRADTRETRKQKVKDDKEIADLKQLMEIILNEEEVAINAIPLAVKSLKIVD